MKIIFLIVAVICGSSLANIVPRINFDLKELKAPRDIDDDIRNAIERLKKQMPCGFPDFGIPVLAPFEKSYTDIEYSNRLFELIASFIDLNIDGLNVFDIREIKVSELTLKASFKFNFNEFRARSQYVAKAYFFLTILKVSGDGDLDITFRDLQFTGFAQLGVNSEGLYMKDIYVVVTLRRFKSDITGLTWGKLTGRLANIALEAFVPLFVRTEKKMISEFVQTIVTTNVNEVLKGKTIQDLIDFINKDPVKCVPKKLFL